MEIKYYVIGLLKTWNRLPTAGAVSPPVKDTASLLPEQMPETIEFDESQLRNLVLANKTGLPGIVVNAESIDALPVGSLRAYYEHLRYQMPLPEGWLPLRSGSSFAGGEHRIGIYIVMERILQCLLNDYAKTTDPENKYKARNMHLLATKVRFMINSVLTVNPLVNNPNKLIVGAVTELVGKVDITQTKHIFFDEEQLALYKASGKTEQDAIDWYLNNGTQPTY